MSSIVALLTSALMLLNLAQSSADLPQSFRDHAISVAQEAINEAQSALSQQVIDSPIIQSPIVPSPVSSVPDPTLPALYFTVQPHPADPKKIDKYWVYPGAAGWQLNQNLNHPIGTWQEVCSPAVQNNTHPETGYIWEVFPGTYTCNLELQNGQNILLQSDIYSFVVPN